jgi:acyl carrier protein
MTQREVVVRVATELGLVDSSGQLLKLDSLSIVDLVVGLEDEMKIEIPIGNLSGATFETIDSVNEMLAGLPAGGRPE